MIKSELIARLAEENPHLTQRDIERVVGVILERMIQALEQDGRVELRLLEDIGREGNRALRRRAEALTEWLAGARVRPRFPSPLTKG